MRYDADHKQRTHEKVVMEAANAIREFGPDKVGVAALMAKAGLTHGGFYAHFSSKDDLIAQAVDCMFQDRLALLQEACEQPDPGEGLSHYIDFYLSPLHRDRRDRGCPVVALSGDMARMPDLAKVRFEAGLVKMTSLIADLLRRIGVEQPETMAVSLFTEMVGAMSLARAVASQGHSKAILEQARASVKNRVGLHPIPKRKTSTKT